MGRITARRRPQDFARVYDLAGADDPGRRPRPAGAAASTRLARNCSCSPRSTTASARSRTSATTTGSSRRPASRRSPSSSRRVACVPVTVREWDAAGVHASRREGAAPDQRPRTAQPVRPGGLVPRASPADVRVPLPDRDLHPGAEAAVRLLRAAVPARRRNSSVASTSRPTAPTGALLVQSAWTEPGVNEPRWPPSCWKSCD